MSDNRRRYRAIRNALAHCYGGNPQGNLARHLTTLAAFISGIVGSESSQLPKIASYVPDGNKTESRVKRFARWVGNDKITQDIYFLPYADVLLRHLALETLVLVIDGSTVGRGCVALMISVVYKGRALPVAWLVRQGKKGHFPQDIHIAAVEQVKKLVPQDAQVVFLGDGEFDGTSLQETLRDYHWSYVCRTGSNITVEWEGESFHCDTLGACIKPGTLVELIDVLFTKDYYGPIMLVCCWAKGYKEPIYLVTNMSLAEEACRFYAKRFRIETFFSDQKSRGFNLHKSHIANPERLSRLLIATCLAYIWIIYLGVMCIEKGWVRVIHRHHRCDLSLFQLGLRLLTHFLNEGIRIPVAFHVLI